MPACAAALHRYSVCLYCAEHHPFSAAFAFPTTTTIWLWFVGFSHTLWWTSAAYSLHWFICLLHTHTHTPLYTFSGSSTLCPHYSSLSLISIILVYPSILPTSQKILLLFTHRHSVCFLVLLSLAHLCAFVPTLFVFPLHTHTTFPYSGRYSLILPLSFMTCVCCSIFTATACRAPILPLPHPP